MEQSVTGSHADGPRAPAAGAGLSAKLANAAQLLELHGIPPEDSTTLPDSPLTFPDGGHFRLEISGIERLSTLEAMIDESQRRGLFVHRIVAFVAGATLLDRGELKAFAELAGEHGIEVIAVPGPRAAWDLGRQAVTQEGKAAGGRVRGSDNLRMLLEDYLRCLEAGFTGLLVWDEGVLDILATARARGDIPRETKLKVSTFTGHGNAAALRLLATLGADSVNPVGDLSRPMLAAIRSVVDIPLDVYAYVYDSFGGMNRLWEAGEIARVASPCYYKMEPGESEKGVYTAWADPAWMAERARDRVRYSEILIELAQRTTPAVAPSPGPG